MKRKTAAMLVLVLTAAVMFGVTAVADGTGEDISPAIEWLRRNTKIEKSAERGAGIYISGSDFERAVGTEVEYVSIVGLPKPEDGRLCLGGVDVSEGQTVIASALDKLVLIPAENAKRAEFSVKCEAEGWHDVVIPFAVTFAEGTNGAPSLTPVVTQTVSGVCCVAEPTIYDPDGDKAELRVITYPQNGSVRVAENKIYYTPSDGFVGTDTMTAAVTDNYGNTSPETKISFEVSRNTYSIYFADMKNSPAHAAAVALAEKSVVAFTRRDGEYYFSPKSDVCRVDFVVMLLSAAGVSTDGAAEVSLKFDDMSGVSDAKLMYLKKAADMGIIDIGTKSFSPGSGITRIAAAEWLCKMLELSAKGAGSFSDMADCSEDERFYASAVVEARLMNAENGKFRPGDILSKAEAAVALKRVMDLARTNPALK